MDEEKQFDALYEIISKFRDGFPRDPADADSGDLADEILKVFRLEER